MQAIDTELAQSRDAAKADGARVTAERLNQTIRRLRQTTGEVDLLAMLVDTSAPFSTRAAGIVLNGTRARAVNVRGFVAPEIEFEIGKAAALLSAIETKDPVVAAASESELSPELCGAALRDMETVERAYLFPLVSRGSVRAVLFALGSVQPATLELLTETAGMRLEALDAGQRVPPKPAGSWTDLPANDQAVHLKAQRFARVAVAEIRLSRPAAVREGQERGALYNTLRPEIDAARDKFRKEFVSSTPSMVDYLYIELVRSLANDNDRLLGPDFPGRLI